MKQAILILIIIITLSCNHYSEVKYEGGVVLEKSFSPEFKATGSGVGFSSGGHTVFTQTEISKQEQFVILFKCDHNVVFPINSKELYALLNKGDSVDIQYREILNKKNKVVDFEFLTATIK